MDVGFTYLYNIAISSLQGYMDVGFTYLYNIAISSLQVDNF